MFSPFRFIFAESKLVTIFRIPELRRKIYITALFLIIYRIGYYIPLPTINQAEWAKTMAAQQSSTLGQVLGFVSLFSGGNLSSACIFAMGIMLPTFRPRSSFAGCSRLPACLHRLKSFVKSPTARRRSTSTRAI